MSKRDKTVKSKLNSILIRRIVVILIFIVSDM